MQDAAAHQGFGRLPLPAVFGLLVAATICLSPKVMYDGDTYTHVAAGSWMIEHWSVLRADPFTATFAGRPWNAHEWLSEVLFAAAYRADGLTGVLLLTAAAVALAFANLARHLEASAGRVGTMLLTVAALVCVVPSVLARPHMLALPLLELWVAELLVARREGRSPGWWLLPVMAGWANMHGGFAFGLAIALVFAVEATMERATRRVVWLWWMFVAAATGAALLTPQGWDGLLFPFRLLQLHCLALIMEWQPVDFTRDVGFGAVLFVLVALLGLGLVRMTWWRLLLLAGLVYLSFAHVRHQVLFGMVGALILAEPVGRALAAPNPLPTRPVGRSICWAGIGLTLLLRLAAPIPMGDSPPTPVSAVAQLPPGMAARPMLNSIGFGGYLEMADLHPFIDGRLELFGDAFIFEANAMAQPGGQQLQRGIERYGIEWAILAVDDPLVANFNDLAGWRRQYEDAVAVVFVRT